MKPTLAGGSGRCLALGTQLMGDAVSGSHWSRTAVSGFDWGFASRQCRRAGGELAKIDSTDETIEAAHFLTEHIIHALNRRASADPFTSYLAAIE